jgi:hypothetical protein
MLRIQLIHRMPKNLTLLLSALAALALPSLSMALDAPAEVEIKGLGQCAKCSLKQTDSCQNAIVTTLDGKQVTFFLTKNKLSDAFHSKVCKAPAEVVAKGTVSEREGKQILTVTSIALAQAND